MARLIAHTNEKILLNGKILSDETNWYMKGYTRYGLLLTHLGLDDYVVLQDLNEDNRYDSESLAILNHYGLGPKPEHIIYLKYDFGISEKEFVLLNQEKLSLIKKLNIDEICSCSHDSLLANYLSHQLHITIDNNLDHEQSFEKKTLLNTLNAQLHFGPEGIVCDNKIDMLNAAKKLFQKFPTIVIKKDCSSGGFGQQLFHHYTEIEQYVNENLIDEPYVMTQWFEDVSYSPSVNYLDSSSYSPIICDQIFPNSSMNLNEIKNYCGVVYPSKALNNKQLKQEILNNTLIYRESLVEKGYHGPIGFDILVRNSHAYIVDLNPRKTTTNVIATAAQYFNPKMFYVCSYNLLKNNFIPKLTQLTISNPNLIFFAIYLNPTLLLCFHMIKKGSYQELLNLVITSRTRANLS